jgi:hypothetical protein
LDAETDVDDKVLKWKKAGWSRWWGGTEMAARIRSAECLGFQLLGEPPVMKFMKYPIAKWAILATVEVTDEMTACSLSIRAEKSSGQRRLEKKESTRDFVPTRSAAPLASGRVEPQAHRSTPEPCQPSSAPGI